MFRKIYKWKFFFMNSKMKILFMYLYIELLFMIFQKIHLQINFTHKIICVPHILLW